MITSYIDEFSEECSNEEAEFISDSVFDEIKDRISD